MKNHYHEEYAPGTNMRKYFREQRYEKRRMEFVAVRKAGGGDRERLRRRIGGFYRLHDRFIPCEQTRWPDGY